MYADQQKQKEVMAEIHSRFEEKKREEVQKSVDKRKELQKQIKLFLDWLTSSEMEIFVTNVIIKKKKIRFVE